MREIHHIAPLLKKHIQGELSPEEEVELRQWAGSDAAYQRLLDRVSDGVALQTLLQMRHELERQETADYVNALQENVMARISDGKRTGNMRGLHRLLPYAAAVLVIAAVASWVFWSPDLGQHREVVKVVPTDIQPGGNRATLTLTDGRKIELSDVQAGIVVGDKTTYSDGSDVLSIGDRRLRVEDDPQRTENDRTTYALLSTPEGGVYRITLPDGTTVWLNSASSLKYPTHFDTHERVVELTGEAYFDVAKLSESGVADVPFKVVSTGQTVEVLGTEFNIAAYTDERETKTTLVKGVVQVVNHESNLTKRLKPGDQTINRDGNITIKHVDVGQFTAWKDGFFYFDEMEPEIAFSQLERWYGIDVVYQGRIPQIGFFGMIDRNKPLSAVLKTLEKSGIKFKVEHAAGTSRLTILDEQNAVQ